MYRNLNQLIDSNLQVKHNNNQLDNSIAKQYSIPISFRYNDLLINTITNQKIYIVQNRLIKNCVIKCPNGQMLDNLQYTIHSAELSSSSNSSDNSLNSDIFYPLYKVLNEENIENDAYILKTDIDYTIFDFSYIQDNWWNKNGIYVIYPGHNDKSVSLYNSFSNIGVSLLHIDGYNYKFKKLIAGNGISLFSNQDSVLIQSGQSTCYSLPQSFDQSGVIDLRYGNFQIFSTYNDSQISDIINTLNFQDSSNSSNSQSNSIDFSLYQNVLCVTIMLYKPNQTTFSYHEQLILNKYDTGWFSFTVKKIFGNLFIGQPSRIVTDFVLEG